MRGKYPWSSPCVGICTSTALGDEICRGCGRTKWEVDNWIRMTKKEREIANMAARERVGGNDCRRYD